MSRRVVAHKQVAISQWVAAHREEIFQNLDNLSDLAEVSWKEKQTTAYLREQLKSLKTMTFQEKTGLVATIRGREDGPTIGVRTDLDALWQYVDGTWKANHSCGHHAHMTVALSVAQCLQQLQLVDAGTVKFLFQPAEEVGQGAKFFLEAGVIDDIDYLYGLHLRPKQELTHGQFAPAIYHGAVASLKGEVFGIQAHAARPNDGINVVDTLATIVQAVNNVRVNPMVPTSAKVTSIHAGGDSVNIIPDYGKFAIDLRAQTNEAMEQLIHDVTRAIEAAGLMNGARVEYEVGSYLPAAVAHEDAELRLAAAIREMAGTEAYHEPQLTPGGEDFHYYSVARPEMQTTMLGVGCDLAPGLHHPHMAFNETAILTAIEILAYAVAEHVGRDE